MPKPKITAGSTTIKRAGCHCPRLRVADLELLKFYTAYDKRGNSVGTFLCTAAIEPQAHSAWRRGYNVETHEPLDLCCTYTFTPLNATIELAEAA